jgi:hypothetical protein
MNLKKSFTDRSVSHEGNLPLLRRHFGFSNLLSDFLLQQKVGTNLAI